MKLIKITDREAFERLLRGEEVYYNGIPHPHKLDASGVLRYNKQRAYMGEFEIPEPIRELTGWEALDALREGCCVQTGGWVYRFDHAGIYCRDLKQTWYRTGRTMTEFLEAKYTLCTPDGKPTNDKEEARWK